MTATLPHSTSNSPARLYVALEMGFRKIKVGSCTGAGCKPRIKEVAARDLGALNAEFTKAKERFGLPADTAILVCYEAGRDGFWLHRWLTAQGHDCRVVDPGSVRVNQRRKRAKSDRLDAQLLLSNLIDEVAGKKDCWSVARVPTLVEEERRQLHRELETLKGERTEHVNRIKSVLATLGLELEQVGEDFPTWLEEQRLLETGEAIPPEYQERLRREYQRWQLVEEQIVTLQETQRQRVAQRSGDRDVEKTRKLMDLKGLGVKSSWLFVQEIFGWRKFANRRQLAALAGLTPTPYQSSDMAHEMGISKAGNSWLRGMMVEIAWSWLQWQPNSSLAQWFQRRFAQGGKRHRKIGVVAVARKLLIALWRWLEFDVWPEGAVRTDWRQKVGLKAAG